MVGAASVLLLLLSMGCATSTQYRQALHDRDNEIRGLREERTSLKNELRDLQNQNASLETALSEANGLLEASAEIAQSEPPPRTYSELEDFGITTQERNGAMVITVPSNITFASGKAELKQSGREAIGAVARSPSEGLRRWEVLDRRTYRFGPHRQVALPDEQGPVASPGPWPCSTRWWRTPVSRRAVRRVRVGRVPADRAERQRFQQGQEPARGDRGQPQELVRSGPGNTARNELVPV